MPYTYRIDPERRLAIIRVSGQATGDTFLEAVRAVAADPAWQPGFSRLWDAGGVTELGLTPDEVSRFRAEMQEARYRAHRTAMVVHRDVEHSVAHLFRVLLKAWPIQVFWREAEALAWLEEPDP